MNLKNRYIRDTKYLHPEDDDNMSYWLQKLGVTRRQLNDAILYTGSIYVADIKSYLKQQSSPYSFGLRYFIRHKQIQFN